MEKRLEERISHAGKILSRDSVPVYGLPSFVRNFTSAFIEGDNGVVEAGISMPYLIVNGLIHGATLVGIVGGIGYAVYNAFS